MGTTPPTKAFVRDDQLWTLNFNKTTHKYVLPVCWENLSEVNDTVHHPGWSQRRINTINYANAAWGDITNSSTNPNPTGNGSAALIYFRDMGQYPDVRVLFRGVRILVSSTYKLLLPDDRLLPPPYTRALGRNLTNIVHGLVLDFDNKLIYNANISTFKGCKAQLISEENCYKVVSVHEFGHVPGMSHEQDRSDEPLPYRTMACGTNDPSPVLGHITFGNLRIGVNDDQSIIAYCNLNHFRNPALSVRDKIVLRAFYGNMPSLNTSVGWDNHVGKGIEIIRTPSLKIGSTYYNAELRKITDANHDGIYDNAFTLVKTPISGNVNVSNCPVSVVNGVMDIKMAKRTVSNSLYPYPFGKVYYLGELKAIPGTADKWAVTSNYGSYNAQYPITQQN